MVCFADKVALITGSTRGIGLATARMIAAQGGKVIISSRNAEACDNIRDDFLAQGWTAIACPAHAAREEDIARLAAETLNAFGRLDVVVANAAINPTFDPLTDIAEASWAKVMDTNVSGPLRLARHTLPHLEKTGGAIVFVSSINSRVAMERSGPYGISKAALEQMVRQLAVEWGPRGVRVNAVAPGTTRTDMIRALMARPDYLDNVRSKTPLRRIAEPEDIAAAICFFASEGARHITGQILVADGGQTITRGV